MSRKFNGKQTHSGPGGASGVGLMDGPDGATEQGYSAEEMASFLELAAEHVQRISVGDVPPRITDEYSGTLKKMKDGLNAMIDVIHARNADIQLLIEASVQGKLDFRADSKKYSGENGKMVAGINQMLDAILLPIGE